MNLKLDYPILISHTNLTFSKTEISATDDLTVTVQITNTGKRAGKEAVLLYLSDKVASIT
jgi:beta-glucosidase